MAELKDLYPFVLMIVLVGMIIGVGAITMEKFGAATFNSGNDFNDTVTIGANNTLIALSWGNITKVERVVNFSSADSNNINSLCYTINATSGQFLFTNVTECHHLNTTVNVIYDYKDYNTVTRVASGNVITELSGIASNWLGLIVTVLVLAIILGLVIASFGRGFNR